MVGQRGYNPTLPSLTNSRGGARMEDRRGNGRRFSGADRDATFECVSQYHTESRSTIWYRMLCGTQESAHNVVKFVLISQEAKSWKTIQALMATYGTLCCRVLRISTNPQRNQCGNSGLFEDQERWAVPLLQFNITPVAR